jgi:hypothetical protein
MLTVILATQEVAGLLPAWKKVHETLSQPMSGCDVCAYHPQLTGKHTQEDLHPGQSTHKCQTLSRKQLKQKRLVEWLK